MNNKNIIIAGAIAIGLYLFSQTKKITTTTAQKVAQRTAQKVAQKVAPKRIGQPTTWAAHIAAARKAAARKAAVRKAAAQKIGKKIGKTVAQKISQNLKTRRAVAAWYAKRQKPLIQQPNLYKKQRIAKLFPGAEKSRIIPYSESSKHSYFGSKSRKVLNEGYMEKRYKADQKQAQDARLEELRAMFPSDWA